MDRILDIFMTALFVAFLVFMLRGVALNISEKQKRKEDKK